MILGGSHDGQFVRKGCAADGVVAVSVERLGVEYLRILDLCVPADFAVPFLLLGNRPVLLGGLKLVAFLSRVRLYQRHEHGLPELNDLAGLLSTSVHEGSLMQVSMMLLEIRSLRLHTSEAVWLVVLKPICSRDKYTGLSKIARARGIEAGWPSRRVW